MAFTEAQQPVDKEGKKKDERKEEKK